MENNTTFIIKKLPQLNCRSCYGTGKLGYFPKEKRLLVCNCVTDDNRIGVLTEEEFNKQINIIKQIKLDDE